MLLKPHFSNEILAAALLADHDYEKFTKMVDKINLRTVIGILQANQVPLVGFFESGLDAVNLFGQDDQIQERIESEFQIWQQQRYEYHLVLDSLKRQGVPCVLIKSVGMSPSFPYTSDNVDLMVKNQQIAQAKDVLCKEGYVEFPHIEEPLKFLFRKYSGGESISAIHLHGQVGWGVPFLLNEKLWERLAPSDDDPLVTVPSAEDSLMISISHALYENKRIKLLDIVRIRHCLRRKVDLDFDYIQETISKRGWIDGFLFCVLLVSQLEEWIYGSSLFPKEIREKARKYKQRKIWLANQLDNELDIEDLQFPLKISFTVGKALYYKKILADVERPLKTRLKDVITTLAWGIKLKLGIRGQRGFIVSLSGIDGSGKTNHSQALLNAFITADVKSEIHWSRFGSFNNKSSFMDSNQQQISTSDALKKRREKLHNPVLKFGWLGINLIITCFNYGCKLQIRRKLGGVIICDRYIGDVIVEIKHSLPDNPRLVKFAEWCLDFFCPEPDIAWLLDITGQVASARKIDEAYSEDSMETLENQHNDYIELAPKLGLKILQTENNPQLTTTTLVRNTLDAYFTNYHTFINGLLFSNPSQMNSRIL